MILVAYRHGMRASEVCALRRDDVDLKGESITNPAPERLVGDAPAALWARWTAIAR